MRKVLAAAKKRRERKGKKEQADAGGGGEEEKKSSEEDSSEEDGPDGGLYGQAGVQFANVQPPSSLPPLSLRVLNLSAQFAALLGPSFLRQLTKKEQNNPLFSFVNPNDEGFAYFSSLVTVYKLASSPTSALREGVVRLSKGLLTAAAYRAEEAALKEREKVEEDDAGGAANEIDWDDFVLVETVRFDDVEKKVEGDEMDMDDDEEDDVGEAVEAGLTVVSDYVADVGVAGDNGGYVKDPITGKLVKSSDLSEHLRIALMDPRYAEQAARFKSKQAVTNNATGESLVANLTSFIRESESSRIGKGEEDALARKIEEEEREKKAAKILEKNRDVVQKKPAPAAAPPAAHSAMTTSTAGPSMKSQASSAIPVLQSRAEAMMKVQAPPGPPAAAAAASGGPR
eukprot:CAMPEP_0182475652 /NCGR_PEP_ID=MMETSP1319-20130603/27716_1 /TAXON_ID=172717 /ORGANISM="Bolidomonas pacifica, Strain RCC208" /LENGTH=398 /DNA_ID=CAMNT_0024676665 /DNA_START=24 /DNA_END=1217 /DNA_ORIENTATION=+